MQVIASLNELILLLLCLHVAPPEGGPTRVDLIQENGVASETMVIVRAEGGYLIREVNPDGRDRPGARVSRIPGSTAAYRVIPPEGQSDDAEEIALGELLPGLESLDTIPADLELQTIDGLDVRFQRRGRMVIITPEGGPGVLLVQPSAADPQRMADKSGPGDPRPPRERDRPLESTSGWVGRGFTKIGGGLSVVWKAPESGTLVFAEEKTQVLLMTRTIDRGEIFETGVGDDELCKVLDHLFPGATQSDSGEIRKLRFGLYFKPHE